MPTKTARVAAAIIVLSATLTPHHVVAASPDASAAAKAAACQDVALSKDKLLLGQVLNAQGKPIADAKVWLVDGTRPPVQATTNAQGRFAYQGLPNGVYCLQSGDSVRVCRVWPQAAAPPKSISGVMMVADEQAVRAQMGPPPLLNGFVQRSKKFFAHPAGMLVIGAAIATPIVLAATDDDDPPASP